MNIERIVRSVMEIVAERRPPVGELIDQLWAENADRKLGLRGGSGHVDECGKVVGRDIHGGDYEQVDFLVDVLVGAGLLYRGWIGPRGDEQVRPAGEAADLAKIGAWLDAPGCDPPRRETLAAVLRAASDPQAMANAYVRVRRSDPGAWEGFIYGVMIERARQAGAAAGKAGGREP